MTEFDKKIKELSRNIEIPKGYSQKIDDTLRSLDEREERKYTKPHWINKKRLGFAICLIGIFCFLRISTIEANANIFETFQITIMDFLNIGKDEEKEKLGLESNTEQVESKPDLMLELKEAVIDSNGIYLLVKVTAPTNVVFDKEITFDYFAFSEGENYNADKLIGGIRDCHLLETMEEKPNVATYVMTLTTDMEAYEGKKVTAYFKDLTVDPNGSQPRLLVEGMWSITFQADATVKEKIEIEGNSDITFPFVNTTAALERVEITPLGMTILSDVSKVPFDDLGISDTTITVRLKLIDGSEVYIMPSNPEQKWIVDGSNVEYSEENGKSYQKDTYSFSEALDITKVVGIYLQEQYVPVE